MSVFGYWFRFSRFVGGRQPEFVAAPALLLMLAGCCASEKRPVPEVELLLSTKRGDALVVVKNYAQLRSSYLGKSPLLNLEYSVKVDGHAADQSGDQRGTMGPHLLYPTLNAMASVLFGGASLMLDRQSPGHGKSEDRTFGLPNSLLKTVQLSSPPKFSIASLDLSLPVALGSPVSPQIRGYFESLPESMHSDLGFGYLESIDGTAHSAACQYYAPVYCDLRFFWCDSERLVLSEIADVNVILLD